MSARIEALHRPARTEKSAVNGMLFRNLAIVFLVGVLGAVAFAFLGVANRTILPEAFEWATAAAVGMLCGFSSRRALRQRTGVLRFMASMGALIVGLIFMGWVSGGDAGMVLRERVREMPDWNALFQLGLGATSAALALSAWQRNGARARTLPPAPVPASGPAPERRSAPRTPPSAVVPASTSLITESVRIWRTTWSQVRATVANLAQSLGGLRHARLTGRSRFHLPTWHLPGVFVRSRPATHAHRVHLIGAEEHRCPYCLDLVERHDARGVVVCKVCHTRHHADCWAVAGTCQVPHYNR